MTRPTRIPHVAVLALAALALPGGAHSEDPAPPCHGPGAAQAATPAEKPPPIADARVEIPDVELADQDGKPVRLRTLLSGDKAIVADFIFTTCTTVCPILSGIMTRMQDKVGDRLGKEVVLVSVSVDPARDTPARMKAYARKWKARAGWVWLTGPKDVVDQVLKGMGAYTPSFTDHPPMVLVGDGRTGTWKRFNGFPNQGLILSRVDEITAGHAGEVVAAAKGQ
jgi:cytochrome oxidase Cu insertion factor (SCO1/SenC/PrrC family)